MRQAGNPTPTPPAPQAIAPHDADDLAAALNEAGLHMVQAPMKLAAGLAGCENPAAAMAVCTDWTSARLNEALADQARVMSAFLALAGPALQRRGPAGEAPRHDV